MGRRKRIDQKGYYYHVMSRGQRKNPIFFSNSDKKYFIEVLKKVLKKSDIKICAFCLMQNHYHLLIYRRNTSMSNFMMRLNTKYALYFNKKYSLVGYVFQGRYKSRIVLNESYLTHLVKYIHQNPYKNREKKYIYSSEEFYINGNDVFKIDLRGILNISQEYSDVDAREIPFNETHIGTNDEFLMFEKRVNSEHKSNVIEKRNVKSKVRNDLRRILTSNKILFSEFVNSKYSRRNRRIKRKILISMMKLGYNESQLAVVMKLHKSNIKRLLDD